MWVGSRVEVFLHEGVKPRSIRATLSSWVLGPDGNRSSGPEVGGLVSVKDRSDEYFPVPGPTLDDGISVRRRAPSPQTGNGPRAQGRDRDRCRYDVHDRSDGNDEDDHCRRRWVRTSSGETMVHPDLNVGTPTVGFSHLPTSPPDSTGPMTDPGPRSA